MTDEIQQQAQPVGESKPNTWLDQPQDRFRLLGEVFFLLSASVEHSRYRLLDVGRLVIEPIRRQQFKLYHRGDAPVGLVTWAFLGAEAESHFVSGKSLRPDQLKSGEALWILDFVAPFGDAKSIAGDLARTSFATRRSARAVRRNPDGTVRKVLRFTQTFHGSVEA